MKERDMGERLCLGVDLGGTNLKLALVTENGKLVEKSSISTEADRGPDHVLSRMAAAGLDMIRRADLQIRPEGRTTSDKSRPEGRTTNDDSRTTNHEPGVCCVGVGAPGLLDTAAGVIRLAANLWPDKDVEARRILQEKMNLPVALNNDANCAAWGEYWAGAGRRARAMLALTLGTGIGGGIVIGGRLFKGACDLAGEFGHMTIDYDSAIPWYKNRGAFEDHASATGMARLARAAIEAGESTTLAFDRADPSRPTAKDIYDAARAGDAVAARVLEQVARWLGVGVANLINVFNPDRIVFTGGMTAAWDALRGPMLDEARRRAFDEAFAAVEIRQGELWNDAGVIGAAGLGLSEFDERQARAGGE